MKVSSTRILLSVGASVFLLAVGFGLGNYYGGKRATYTSNAISLVWLTGIDVALDKGNIVNARHDIDAAIDGYVGALSTLEKNHYFNLISYNSPWILTNNTSLADTILRKTDKYFEKMPDRLRPETREYLAQHDSDKK